MYYLINPNGSVERFRNREDADECNEHRGGIGILLNHFPKESEYFQVIDSFQKTKNQERALRWNSAQ